MTPPHLFDPITLRGLTIPHRLWVAPMCQYSAAEGVPNSWHRTHLGQYAIGRAGLVITEATAVSPEGRISPGCTGIWNTEQQHAWEAITAFSKSQGVPIAIQLAHAGRKAATRILFDLTPGYLMPFAKAINEQVNVAVGTVGLITTPQQAQEALDGSVPDMVLMAR